MKPSRPLQLGVQIALTIPLALYGFLGLFSRYMADDFCTAAHFQSQGFLASLLFWRKTWSGRFSFFFSMNVLHWIGPWITPFMTIIVLLAWWGALYVLMRQFLRVLRVSGSWLVSLLLATTMLFATLSGAPDIYQSLFWLTGQVTYTFPLVFLTVFMALSLHWFSDQAKPSRKALLLGGAITFVAGGFSETYVVVQLAAILAFASLTWIFATGEMRRSGLRWFAAGAAGSILALILVVTAPGNAVRMATMPERINMIHLVALDLRYTLSFFVRALRLAPLTSLLALLFPGLWMAISPVAQDHPSQVQGPASKKLIPLLIGIPVVAVGLIGSTIAPSLYATAAYPADRVFITAQFTLIAAFVAWSMLLGLAFRPAATNVIRHPDLIWAVCAMLVIAAVVFSAHLTLYRLPTVQGYAQLWDTRDQKIRTAVTSGTRTMSAASLPHINPGLGDLSTDPNDWINRCVALNYGLDQVTGR